MKVRSRPEETAYISESSPEDFMYDAVDEDLFVEVNGRSPFPQGSHRVSNDGFVLNVPILVFIWNLLAACKRLYSKDTARERVVITSTDYTLEFQRQGKTVLLKVKHQENHDLSSLAEVEISLLQLMQECKSLAEITLVGIMAENPEVKTDAHLQRISASVKELAGRLS